MACAYRHLVDSAGRRSRSETTVGPDQSKTVIGGRLQAGQTLRIVKFVAYHTSTGVPAEELADRCHRTLDRAIADGHDAILDEQRAWLDALLGRQRHRAARRRRRPAGRALEPVPAGPGQRPDPGARHRRQGRHRRRLRGPLLLGHRDVRRAVPRLHEPGDGPQAAAVPLAAAGQGPRAGRRAEPGRRAVPVAHDQRRRGVGVLRRRHRAVPHQRGHRLRPQALPRRQRRRRLPRRRGGRDLRRDGPAVGGPRVLLDQRCRRCSGSTA